MFPAGAFLADYAIAWWVLVPLFFLVEVLVVHIDLQRDTQTISLSEVPIVVGLFLVPSWGLVAAQLAGGFVALAFHRRQVPVKIAFNLAQFAAVTTVAIIVFRALAPAVNDPVGPQSWIAALCATVAADLVAVGLLTAVFAIAEGDRSREDLAGFIRFGFMGAVANTGLGMLAVVLFVREPVATALLVVPVSVTIVAYRGYWSEHRRREHLEFLYGSMQRLNSAVDFEMAVTQLLHDAREVFHAGVAGVVLVPIHEGARPTRSVIGENGDVETLTEVDLDLDVVLGDRNRPVVHTAGSASPRLLLGRRVSDAITIQLEGEGAPIGMLVVADRVSDDGRFSGADLDLLKTYATHAGVALENRQLQSSIGELARENDELAVRALHDPLTQLPNRILFQDRVDRALIVTDGRTAYAAVLFIDLDDFKGVNDTYGHAAGDLVLSAVADRLRSVLRPGDTASRFGGDEFAVLLADLAQPEEANLVADRLRTVLHRPVSGPDGQIPVGASIGIAVSLCGATTAAVLLDEADARMYEVKFAGKALRPAVPEAGTPATNPSRMTV